MERCNAKSQTPERRTKPEGTVLWGQARQDERTEEQQEDIDIVWDPEGPLAPEEGQRPYSIHPPPNGDVRVTNPETYYGT